MTRALARVIGVAALVAMTACAREPRPAPSMPQPREQPRPVDGESIDIELVDVELIEAIRGIAAAAHVNAFADSDIRGRATIHARAAPWRDVLGQLAADHALRIETLDVAGVARPSIWVSNQSSPPAPQTHFTGAAITARFDDAPIRDVAKALSEVGKTDIRVANDIDMPITLHMRLPWDLALYHLAQKYELKIVRSQTSLEITHH